MKIVYIIDWLDNSGGKERIISTKANYLAKSNDVYIICLKSDEHFFPLCEKITLISLGLNFRQPHSLSFMKKNFNEFFLKRQLKKKLNSILHKIKADIVISTYSEEMAIITSIRDGSKKILELHFGKGSRLMYAKSKGMNFVIRFFFALDEWYKCKFVIPKYDEFVVLTEQDKAEWKKYGINATRIYNPLTFASEQTAALDSKTAISVGRLEIQKDYLCLIEIWDKIHKKFPEWKLRIFGDGSQKKMLMDKIANLGLQNTVFILPPEKDIKARYLESSLYLATSCYEGFHLALIEASECGLPIISFDIKYGPREIVKNGESGFLIEFKDKEYFAEKAMSLMESQNLRTEFGKNAKQKAKEFYLENIMPQWEKLFKAMP